MIGLILGGMGTVIGFFIQTLITQADAGMAQANAAMERTHTLNLRVTAVETSSSEYIKRLDERFAYIQKQLEDLKQDRLRGRGGNVGGN